MDFEDESVSITAPLLALAMINVVPDEFAGLTFGVSSVPSNLTPKVSSVQNTNAIKGRPHDNKTCCITMFVNYEQVP